MCCLQEHKIEEKKEDINNYIPEGTIMIFYQKSAPKGWKLLNINNNKSIICVKIEEEE